jgi:hypothetical protein
VNAKETRTGYDRNAILQCIEVEKETERDVQMGRAWREVKLRRVTPKMMKERISFGAFSVFSSATCARLSAHNLQIQHTMIERVIERLYYLQEEEPEESGGEDVEHRALSEERGNAQVREERPVRLCSLSDTRAIQRERDRERER